MSDFRNMSRPERKKIMKAIRVENSEFPAHLIKIESTQGIITYRSRGFLAQVHDVSEGIKRITVNRSEFSVETGDWLEGITWDMLMKIKREVGYGDCDAVEVYPADKDIVNVANMRHLFVMIDHPLSFAWRK